ncbi:radical SAM protein, partial [Desulfovibrio sp. OttesenSCG-928-F07]|nr:radical SAM protein [Desulfovibrio sp. OttesenSCG-928-F07]
KNIMVSNGYMSTDTFEALNGLIDAANFDLKSFSDSFYSNYCGARLKPVLNTIERALKNGWWVELTTLLIGGVNDSDSELDELAAYIATTFGANVPWHVSRFRPAYKMMSTPPTPVSSLERALEAGYKHGLHYVYAGNIPGHEAESTFCPSCKTQVVYRCGFSTSPGFNGICHNCGTAIAGVW